MIKRTMIWTAIPNGRTAGGALKLVCLVSPRLTTDNGVPATLSLGLYDDWVNWADKAIGLEFPVSIGGGAQVIATRVSADPELPLWQALFTPSTLVRPFQFSDHTANNIRSYPALNVVDAIKKFYTDTAVGSATVFPPASGLLEKGLAADIGFPRSAGTESQHLAQLNARFSGGTKALPPGPPEPLWDFLQVKRFHLIRPNARPVDPAPMPEPLDFHQVLALLMEYPAMQRRLGLAFDLTVPAPVITGNTTVRILMSGPENRSPVTLATIGPGVFEPRAAGDVSGGMLNLAGTNFGVLGMDVDGGALKVRQLSDTVRRAWLAARRADTPDRYPLPALRSSGIAVVRTGRAVRQVSRFADNKAKDIVITGGGTVNLDADTLLRGFRWHVYDVHSGRWYSLCQRTGAYELVKPGKTLPVVNPDDPAKPWEEGVITGAATRRVDGSGPDFFMAEYLCRWTGESLVAPGPGKSLHRDPGAPPEVPQTEPPAEFPFRASFAPQPGSLPPLRYGRRYRLRAAASYVGGAGRRFVEGDTSSDFSQATAEWTHLRLEPIAPPDVLMRKAVTAGESVHHLVIRTDWQSAPGLTAPTERHILPPKIAQRDAEQHGMFDGPTGVDPVRYNQICARESGRLTGGVADPANHNRPYFDAEVLSFPVEGTATAQLPWLADPFARGAALFGLPGMAGAVKRVDFGQPASWPNLLPFRLRLTEGGGAPVPIVDSGRGWEVRLGKADVAEVELSSYPLAGDLDQLQIWRWVADANPAFPPATVAARRAEALDGRAWLLTPRQKLVLVCATRRPLLEPAFQQFTINRGTGQTHATVSDTLVMSRKSTASVELRAQWADPVDELVGQTWQPTKLVTKTADLGEVRVARSPGGDTLPISKRHDFADTKTHVVTYTAVAKSRFAEYFAERATVTLSGTNAVPLDARGLARNCEEVSGPGGNPRYGRGIDYDVDYPAGTIARRAGGGIADGAAVEVAFLPPISHETNLSDQRVRSSARPAPPVPLYVVPTFGWDEQRPSQDPQLQGDVVSHRYGNGLRIYLDRPWWSSGRDEQLAVVLLAGGQLTDDLRPYITAWGMDPIYHSTPLATTLPAQGNFPRRSGNPGPVVLAERAGQQVMIAPHEVMPDLKRRLWFCDVEVTGATSYHPFIRLALARYQPWANPGLELSTVAMADFAQLTPDRAVGLGYVGSQDVRVTVIGHSYQATKFSPTPYSRVVATLERRDPRIPGELGWVEVDDFPLAEGLPFTGGQTNWSGTVHLPVPRGTERLRFVIREYERFGGSGERPVFTDSVEIL
jgi:hypothetical protein